MGKGYWFLSENGYLNPINQGILLITIWTLFLTNIPEIIDPIPLIPLPPSTSVPDPSFPVAVAGRLYGPVSLSRLRADAASGALSARG